jgi:bifunctional non-homologous end joining protein LigD
MNPPLMLCSLVEEPVQGARWIFEPKLDGLRLYVEFDGREVRLLSRNGKPQNAFFPEIVERLSRSLPSPAALDGELVCLDERGQSSFRMLQQRFHVSDAGEVSRRAARYPVVLYLFDILTQGREDLRALPLLERKKRLRRAVRWSEAVRFTPQISGTRGPEFFAETCQARGEGVIAKRIESTYHASRTGDWLKIKCIGRQEFVIGGWTDPRGSRTGLGALLIGYPEAGTRKLVYAGKVGTGFGRETLLELKRRLGRLERETPAFVETGGRRTWPRGENVHWAEPRLVCEIAFAEWTQNGLLRQPRFEGLREDKEPEMIPLEEYRRKRNFRKTREPEPDSPRKRSPGQKAIFVVQEHHASHLHYDFRLEIDGVLKSWAVPKEPTLDPSVRRLAVEVEDHPLEYATFEGRIAEGEYGAGDVRIWDHGTFELLGDSRSRESAADAIDRGKLEFRLHGEKLRGIFTLVRMKGRGERKPQWLLIKKRDAETASRAPALRVLKSAPAFTNTDKIFFPEAGLSKGDVLDYYREISPWLIPHLARRPLTLERAPDGVRKGAPGFWQKNTPAQYPSFVQRARLSTERGKPVAYAMVDGPEALLYLVNQGTITFHPWLSRVDDPDRPDYVIFDLDRGKQGFAPLVQLAKRLRAVLSEAGCEPFVKTSGKTGLHVLAPWEGEGGYDEARAWAIEMARETLKGLPGVATLERSIAKRGGLAYLDIMQNAKGHHVVPPYVIRAVPGASISTPLQWSELSASLDPGRFDPRTVLRRMKRLGRDLHGELLPRPKRSSRRAA